MIFSSYRANTNLVEITLDPASPGQRKWLTKDFARSETAPRYSPDGRQIAYFTNRSGAEREGIWVMDADGGNPTQLVEDRDRRTSIRAGRRTDRLIFYSRIGWEPRRRRAAPRRTGRRSAGGAAGETLVSVLGMGRHRSRRTNLFRTSATTGELFDPRTKRREAVPDLLGDPLWSDDGGSSRLCRPEGALRANLGCGWPRSAGQPPGV